jgi:hypothetical protein
MINKMFKGIIDLSIPNFVKHLFWGSVNNKGLFEPEVPVEEHTISEEDPVDEEMPDSDDEI